MSETFSGAAAVAAAYTGDTEIPRVTNEPESVWAIKPLQEGDDPSEASRPPWHSAWQECLP